MKAAEEKVFVVRLTGGELAELDALIEDTVSRLEADADHDDGAAADIEKLVALQDKLWMTGKKKKTAKNR